ncbi:MAG: hypothetical protein NT039_02185 [Candidatus Berkelbacteria bacterium]|nr:hypothetical protein [Candidatus Berkelbacteria bacterium]
MPEENVNQNQNMDTNPTQLQDQTTETQDKSGWLPEEMASIQLHAQQVAKSENGWKEETHQKMADLKKLATSPEAGTSEGMSKLEEDFGNLGMPGIRNTGVALDQLDRREEAMFEERTLRDQGTSYTNLDPQQKQQAEARIYNGVNFRKDWFGVYDYTRVNGQKFDSAPTTPVGKEILRQLQTMVGNEVRLAAAREPRLGLDYKDNPRIVKITDQILNDPAFISTLNQEGTIPNTSKIKYEIKKRIPTQYETPGNL